MMSSKQRTYARKRKDTAEDKFDALIVGSNGKKHIKVDLTEVKKRRKNQNETYSPSKTRQVSNGVDKTSLKPHGPVSTGISPAKRRETAADKFDAIIGGNVRYTPVESSLKKSSQTFASSDSDDDVSVEIKRTAPNADVNTFSYKTNKTKYDVLFKKNEKNASDKFDAIFGDELENKDDKKVDQNLSAMNKGTGICGSEKQFGNPDFDNLFGFADPLNTSTNYKPGKNHSPAPVSPTFLDLDKIQRLSPTKSPTKAGITGASMKTVGGKVVLNIQKRTKSPKKPLENVPMHKAYTQCARNIQDHGSPSDNDITMKDIGQEWEKPTVTSTEIGFKSRSSIGSSFTTLTSNKHKSEMSVGEKLQNASISLMSTKQPNGSSRSDSSSPSKLLRYRSHGSKQNIGKKPVPSDKQPPTSKPSYNSRPWMPDSEETSSVSDISSQSLSQAASTQSNPSLQEVTPKLTRSVTWPNQVGESIVTSIKCDKDAKSYFTVVKHVKNYQNCLEEGEAQEFEDDVNYLLEGLHPSQPISVRCLSVTNLASKCQQHNFRLYLRAHNVSNKVFSNLEDAKDNQELALSTATLLFMLSRDRQMEINKTTLQLLLRLVDPFDKDDSDEQSTKSGESKDKGLVSGYKFFKSKGRAAACSDDEISNTACVKQIKAMVDACGDALLSGKDISVKRLASEALLRFTARRTAEWFREEIRLKGGLDHIISVVKSYVETLELMSMKSYKVDDFEPIHTLCTLERLLKVLENGIVKSARNAMYLVTHQRAVLLKKISSLMSLCKAWLLEFPSCVESSITAAATPSTNVDPYTALHNVILQIIKLLVNISNDNEWVSSRVGEQDGMLTSIVGCVLSTPAQLKPEHRYELILLSLSLLVNLVESSAKNRIALMHMTMSELKISSPGGNSCSDASIVQLLVRLFVDRELSARDNEVLGEVGVKKAVKAKKEHHGNDGENTSSSAGSQPGIDLRAKEADGHWEETEDGIEWIPSETSDDVISASQESYRSAVSSGRNPENSLTAEEKNEMKETLDKANEHMEDSIVASYAALVLGCLIHGNRANANLIRAYLNVTDGFSPMIRMLKKFLSFMSLTAGMSKKGEKTLTQIIEDMEEEESKM